MSRGTLVNSGSLSCQRPDLNWNTRVKVCELVQATMKSPAANVYRYKILRVINGNLHPQIRHLGTE